MESRESCLQLYWPILSNVGKAADQPEWETVVQPVNQTVETRVCVCVRLSSVQFYMYMDGYNPLHILYVNL